ncbi:MAG: CbiX/SirB N-terminal domain-containing protein [Planctomycetota bacterium]
MNSQFIVNDASATSLVLVAHGAVDAPRSNQPLHQLAQRVAMQSDFAAVTPAFLNGEPLVSEVLGTLATDDVIVVPVMTSEGYYLKKLPAIFQQNRDFDSYRIRTTPVVGLHAGLADLMQQRIRQHLMTLQIANQPTTVVLIGHGTRRNTNSGTTTFQLADQLKSLLSDEEKLQIVTAFLDQDPELSVVIEQADSESHLIAMPFLIALGPHMTDDVPAALGLECTLDSEFPLITNEAGRVVFCDQPLALYESMPSIVLDLVGSLEPERSQV